MIRWKMEELKKTSDRKFLLILLMERKKKCTNAYSPLSRHLNELFKRVESGEKFDASGNLV